MTTKPATLVVNATELLREPGRRHVVDRLVAGAELDIDDPRLAGDVTVAVTFESNLDDVVVTGRVSAPWRDACRRCLRPLTGTVEVPIEERYAEAPDPDSFAIVNGQIDLRPMVREELLLSVADAPLCRDDCPGLCPVCGADLQAGPCGCDVTTRDERWAVLDQLRAEE